ncbi:hypothetical protein [Helicobacter turcicus]|uniref:Acyltransferase n=1 Tax=Helicobacter turcicus TaxID=2867412 RepID=A0ABS7JQB2_9HELI|nr:hypothetical protein [Helicobacter turcicus]MBX7491547.1 hypothetical protein [Helicobacter turcicus]
MKGILLTKEDIKFPTIAFKGYKTNRVYLADEITNLNISILGDHNLIWIEENVKIQGKLNISIKGDHNTVIIKKETFIHRNLNLLILPGGLGTLANNCKIIVREKNFFNGDVQLFCGEENTSISINEECLFANNIKLITTDNHSIFDITTKQRINNAGNISIGKHCWICDDVTILNHSFIGNNCVVGTKSLVTSFAKSTPPPPKIAL